MTYLCNVVVADSNIVATIIIDGMVDNIVVFIVIIIIFVFAFVTIRSNTIQQKFRRTGRRIISTMRSHHELVFVLLSIRRERIG